MYQYEIYIPTEFDSAIQYVVNTFAIFFGGCTTHYKAEGLWRDNDGLPMQEPITIVRAISTKENDFPTRDMARYIKTTCNQEVVLWTKQTIQATFED